MKTKKIGKKLTLNKKTISNLEIKAMNDVLGGAPSLNTLCETWGTDSCGNTQCYTYVAPAICQSQLACNSLVGC